MKDEDEDIIPNEDKSNEDTNDSNESIDEGFEDIVTLKESISMIITKVKMILLQKLQEWTGFWITLHM
jgi:hypothetical protein